MATTYVKATPFSPPPPPRDPAELPAWLARLVSEIDATLAPLYQQAGNDYARITDVALTAGVDNLIPHSLGRSALNYRLTRVSAQATIWQTSPSGLDTAKHLSLRTSANCTVSLEVYSE